MTTCFIEVDEYKTQEKKHILKRKTRGRPYGVSLNNRIKTDIKKMYMYNENI